MECDAKHAITASEMPIMMRRNRRRARERRGAIDKRDKARGKKGTGRIDTQMHTSAAHAGARADGNRQWQRKSGTYPSAETRRVKKRGETEGGKAGEKWQTVGEGGKDEGALGEHAW